MFYLILWYNNRLISILFLKLGAVVGAIEIYGRGMNKKTEVFLEINTSISSGKPARNENTTWGKVSFLSKV